MLKSLLWKPLQRLVFTSLFLNLRLVDIILTRKELTGKGTFFVLSEAGVEIETTQCQTLDELKQIIFKKEGNNV